MRNTLLLSSFELGPLVARPLHFLSGGELVRCAIASAIAQGVNELLVDLALEQLDGRWRSLLLGKFSGGAGRAALTVADNRLSSDELALAGEIIRFAPSNQEDSTTSALNAAGFDNVLRGRCCMTQLDHLSFRYGRRVPFIFEDVDLTLDPGRIYVLAGPNGAGKTSLLRLLSGTVIPTRGRIAFQGRPFDARGRERFVALSFQNPDFQFSQRTIRDEMLVGASRQEAGVDVGILLLAGGISPSLLDASPYDAPFAFKKRLANLLAVVAGKAVIAFDEPTLGQDTSYRAEFAKLAQNLALSGRTILLISHDENLLAAFPHKVVLKVGDGTVSRVCPE